VGLHGLVPHPALAVRRLTMADLDQKTDRLLGRTAGFANATLAVALGVTLAVIVWPRVEASLGITPDAEPAAYAVGQTIDVPADWYQAKPYTLVLFARATCGACQQAQPFLQQLVADVRTKGDVIVGSPGLEPDADRAYARQLGLDDAHVRAVPAGLRVRATPTLVLVNQRGRILGAWEGVGPAEQQIAIQKSIHAATGAN
jgi:hypothetical protein